MRGELYQVGRLQFQFGAFAPGFPVFRHRRTDHVLALAGDGLRFRADGQLDGAGGVIDPDTAWIAHFDLGESDIRGVPISPFWRSTARGSQAVSGGLAACPVAGRPCAAPAHPRRRPDGL